MSPKPANARKQGIALIAVLSFLGIVLVLALTLVASMRTERVVSEAAKSDTATRLFLKGCVYSAIDEIDGIMWNGASKNIRVPKSLAVIESQGAGLSFSANALLLDGEVGSWLQQKYFSTIDPDFDAKTIADNAKWIDVTDPIAVSTNHPLLGRYVYVAMEGSGNYDVNLVSTNMPRRYGVSIAEVSNLPEIALVNTFQANRQAYRRFATLGEIVELNGSAITSNELNDLMPYSLCYNSGWWDWQTNGWDLTGGKYTNGNTAVIVTNNINRWSTNEAMAVFQSILQVNQTRAGEIATNFFDFLDTNDVPTALDNFSTEAVPMINEIACNSTMNNVAGTVTHTITVSIETWFPFKGNQRAQNFNLQPPVVGTIGSGVGITFQFLPVNVAAFPATATPPAAGPVPATIPASAGYQVSTFTYTATFLDTVITTGTVIQYTIVPENFVERDAALANVDRVRLTIAKAVATLNIAVPSPGNSSFTSTNAISVRDPRMNFSLASWNVAATTLNGQNVGTTTIGPNGTEGTDMFIRNGPLQSPAELGFLNLGSNWFTFPLASTMGRTLLTRFTTNNIGEKVYTNGFVNPNTLNTNVLIAAFAGTPIESYPGDATNGAPSYGYVNKVNQAGPMAEDMFAISSSAAISGAGTFDSGAAWVTIPSLTQTNGALQLLDNNQKESIIRNSYRLFNPNQNLFTLVVIAQTINDVDRNGSYDPPPAGEDSITGEKRAVALVWRDPFPNIDGRHETFVRLFRYLDD